MEFGLPPQGPCSKTLLRATGVCLVLVELLKVGSQRAMGAFRGGGPVVFLISLEAFESVALAR